MARQVTDPPVVQERPVRMSYEGFLAWADEDSRAEWVDGEVIEFMPPTFQHTHVGFFLARLLAAFVERFDLGVVCRAPFEMLIRGGRSSRGPDIAFVAREHLDRLTDRRLDGPADLVVEIVFDDSVTRDRRVKFAEYREAGIPEYWVLDPRPGQRHADFYRLAADGAYEGILPDAAGRVRSAIVPGFWLRPAWLWQDPRPKVDPLVAEIVARGRGEAGSGAPSA